jgi:uncharacterized protein YqgV (UPF0045/DUF77 family)
LYGFAPIQGTVVSASPFVGKVETFLKMANLPYELHPGRFEEIDDDET